jgi:hypothetical protein
MDLQPGQVLEFIVPADIDGKRIEKGTRVRIGQIIAELMEPKVILVVLDSDPPQTLTVPRHVLAVYCRPVAQKR